MQGNVVRGLPKFASRQCSVDCLPTDITVLRNLVAFAISVLNFVWVLRCALCIVQRQDPSDPSPPKKINILGGGERGSSLSYVLQLRLPASFSLSNYQAVVAVMYRKTMM
jgi:hypothetical protein